ncbi:hypothetical protein [Mesorhizobium onobrychidis]|uniref:Uncharacterized protein n=1 Tax=Mesorhizobium onobrychidis TaxID=2775404 RepID=A0ABY5R3G0_9HYPH|nr:hypothetical protein [Mesorhizobium onobrychidis]UVC18016.1 hypothetical protein IHQ72_13570 [Mesorhizobium onobrychidis]
MVDEREWLDDDTDDGARSDRRNSGDSRSPVSGRHGRAELGCVTRRDFLLGGGATLVAAPLAAAEAQGSFLDVAYEDRTRRSLVIAWLEAGKRYAWTLPASTFTDPDLPNGRGRFVLRRTNDGWRADIAQCALPGSYNFALRIELKWDPAFDPQKPGAEPPSMSVVLRRDTDIRLQSGKNLIEFLKADPASGIDEIGGDLSKSQLADLTRTLFGGSFDVSKASQSSLAFHRELYWRLRAGKKLARGEQETPVSKQSRFRALSDEGLSLQFRECIFTVFSGSKGSDATKAFILNENAKGEEQQDVRALFSGDGAPPAPDSTLSDPPDGAIGPAATTSEDERRLAPRVLYALVRHDAEQTKANPADAWTGTLALGRHSGGERGTLAIHEGGDPSFLGWRNQGDQRPVFALRTLGMTLDLRRDQAAEPSRFSDLKGMLWHARGEDDKLRLIASLTPTKRKIRIETYFGRFTVAPLPPIAPRSGVSARVPSIRIGGTGPKNTRTLNHFAAPLALEEAAIPLRSARLAEIARQRATGGDVSVASPAERASRLFSHLTFNEAECLFHIDKLARRFAWIGALAPSTNPPQAEALVHIGATKASNDLPLPARLSLSSASLLVRRPADLLALKYRFQDLLLEYAESGWWVVPDRRIAAFVPRGSPKPSPDVPLVCKDEAPLANNPDRYETRQDPRPLLVVEFPPQHIAERTYLRQFEAEPDLPLPPKGTEVTEAEAEILRSADENTRLNRRTDDIARRQTAGMSANDPYLKFFNDFQVAIDEANKRDNVVIGWKSNIPKDQRIYVGPAYLDLEAARVARKLARKLAATTNDLATPEKRALALRIVPEIELPATVIANLRKDFDIHADVSEGFPEAPLEQSPEPPTDANKRDAYFEAREDLRERLDPRYASFRKIYNDASAVPEQLKPLRGRRNVIATVELNANPVVAAKAVLAVVADFDAKNPIDEPFEIPSEARVSGGSRLVFRIPADDFEAGRPDAREGAPAGAFPFTIEALTNWGAFDLAVVRRAEKVFEPLVGWQDTALEDLDEEAAEDAYRDIANGRLPPRWARQETRDEAARLLHQRISRGDAWAVRRDEQRSLTGTTDCPRPLARLGSVTGPQRMAEIATSVQPPSLFETSIEIPFRLMLSPAQDAAWRTPLGLPPIAKLTAAKDQGWAQGAPVPLWFAQLDEAAGSSSMRAVWSPDFRPEALLDPELGGPPHGPWAPWAMAREVTARNPYSEKEDVWPLPGQEPDPKKMAPERFRAGLDVADRHELVALTSLHGLPVRGRRKQDGTLADGSQINPPSGFKLRHAATEALKEGQPEDDYSAIYRPQPLGVSELTLTALGGSFDADTNFVPPASAKVVPVGEWVKTHKPGNSLFDAFSIERWQQNTRLGRDIRVEVAYKGFLFPFGHRASLVKLTERRFMAGPGGLAAGPVAYLVQRFFLRIGTPLKTFPAQSQPNGGRRWPVERLEILTRVTPDILDPADASPSDVSKQFEEAGNGRIFLRQNKNDMQVLPGLVFWPRVRAREGGEVNFELQIDSRGARARLPLIFVDNTAANDVRTMRILTQEYNRLKRDSQDPEKTIVDPRRVLGLGSSKRRYAPESEPDGTSFETQQWVIEAEGREQAIPLIQDIKRNVKFDNSNFDFGALLQGVDQPPFYPVMATAQMRIAQLDRLLGQTTEHVTVRFDPEYQAFGFPKDERLNVPGNGDPKEAAAKTDVYLDFFKAVELDPGVAGDRIGGAVRPKTPLVAVSRSRGPVGNSNYIGRTGVARTFSDLPPASTGLDHPDPESFFGDATVLGIIDLKKAIQFLVGALSSTPQFREVTQYTSAMLTDLSQEGAADAGAAVAKVRDRLLIPMRETLLTLARQFFDAVKKENEQFDEEIALVRIERLYPDVGRSYRELKDALEQAIAASETVHDAAPLLGAFASIYSAGRRFLMAIERVANDPLAPVHEALREAFNTEIRNLIESAQRILGGLEKELVDALKKVEADVRVKLGKMFSPAAAAFATWRRLVFALPGAHSIPAPLQGQAVAVDKKIEELLEKAAAESKFFEVLAKEGLPKAAQKIGEKFDEALRQAITGAGDDFDKALQAAYGDWKVAAEQEGERIQGVLYAAAFEVIRALLVDTQKLAEQVVKGGVTLRDILGLIQDVVSDALDLVSRLIEYGLGEAGDLCGKIVDTLLKAIADFSPPAPTNVDDKYTDMLGKLDQAKTALDKIGLGADVLSIKTELSVAFGAFIKVRDAYGRAVAEVAKLKADVCLKADPERLPRDALAALGQIRKTLIAKLNAFIVTFSTTRAVGNDLQALMAKITGTSNEDKAARAALAEAARFAAKTAMALGEFSLAATSLGEMTGGKILDKTRTSLESLKGTLPGTGLDKELNALIEVINQAGAAAQTIKTDLEKTIAGIGAVASNPAVPGDEAKYVADLLVAVHQLPGLLDKVGTKIVGQLEQLVISGGKVNDKVVNGLASFLLGGEPYLKGIVSIVSDAAGSLIGFLADLQSELVRIRNDFWKQFGGGDKGSSPPTGIGDDLADFTFKKLAALLLVPCPDPDPACTAVPCLICAPAGIDPPDNDYLTAEKNQLLALKTALGNPGTIDKNTLAALRGLFDRWSSDKGSAQELARRLNDAAAVVLSGDLKRIVDLEGARRRIEAKIKELVPAKIVLNYDLQAGMIDVPPVFLPRSGSQITLSAGAVYDLLEPNIPPQLTASCRLDPFDINLFDVVTLLFDGAQFVNESGKGSDFNIVYKDFELGPNAEFLKPLQALMNPGGSGPYVRPSKDVPGIEAGYSLDLGIITIGTVSFANVSINASCVLPFNGARATFVASIGREDRPVLLSIAPYTGGGFLALYADAQRLLGFAASFEFGGGGAFQFGPLSGQGRITTGIYLRNLTKVVDGKDVDDCIIEGFFYAGGEAHIACFAISATLVVRVGHRSGGSMYGSAVFTFSFSIGFAKIRYQVGVQKNMSKGFSGSRSTAALISGDIKINTDGPVVHSRARAIQEDWVTYQTYFSDIDGFPAS